MSRFDLVLSYVLVAGPIVLGVLIWLVLRTSETRRLTRVGAFRCPILGRNIVAEVEIDAEDGKPVEVNWCTAFHPAARVLCNKRCLLARIGRGRDDRPDGAS